MKFTGHVFDWDGTEPYGKVTDAVLTKSSISLDWSESGQKGHLKAVSRDGVHFTGSFGYPKPDPNLEFDLTLFRANRPDRQRTSARPSPPSRTRRLVQSQTPCEAPIQQYA